MLRLVHKFGDGHLEHVSGPASCTSAEWVFGCHRGHPTREIHHGTSTNRIPSRKTRNGQRATDDINCTIFWSRVVECSILLRLVNYCSLSMEISRNFGILQFGIPQIMTNNLEDNSENSPSPPHGSGTKLMRQESAGNVRRTYLSLFVWKETHKNHYFLSFTGFTWLVVWNMNFIFP